MEMIQINNKVGKIKLNDAVTPWSADELISEIERQYGAKAVAENMTVGGFECSADEALETIEIEINSPGGSVLDGYRIYNSLVQMRSRGVQVIATVNTLAASMGSVILMAANVIKIVEGGRIMIHDASQTVSGTSEDHTRAAKNLEEISEEIATIYSNRTGSTVEEMRDLMKKETWMGAKEAVDRKFADEIMKFDTETKNKMSILAKLFPNNDQVEQIEAAIQEADSIRAELVSSQERIADLESSIENHAIVSSNLIEAQTKITEFEALVESKDLEISNLKAEVQSVDDKAAIKAAELLAQNGHPQPVNLNDEDGQAIKSMTLEAFNSMTPHKRMSYVKEGGKIK
jgi:ATP-dependent Clp endopeptidase proteolytic subunit ClpP